MAKLLMFILTEIMRFIKYAHWNKKLDTPIACHSGPAGDTYFIFEKCMSPLMQSINYTFIIRPSFSLLSFWVSY